MVKKLTIKDMQEMAESRKGKCISKKYIDNKTKIKWKCSEGHTWEATPNNVKQGSWCLICAKLTIKDMQEMAESRGGKCLSREYVNARTKLKWQCAKGHVWEATPSSVKYGTWCPYCAEKKKLTIEYMQEMAESRGGKCLSREYVNNCTKLKWQCSKGHTWEATPNNVKHNSWCPYCAGLARLTIKDMQELAESRGGKCLSKKYVNNHTKLKWECSEGHVWDAIPNSIKQGDTWCPYCSQQRNKKNIVNKTKVVFIGK